MLAEMFPDACSLDIEHCLTIANGDTESAVQLMLLKSERSTTVEKENIQEILDFSPKVHVCGQIHTFRKSITLSPVFCLPRGVKWVTFYWVQYMQLASQKPYPIIVYSVAKKL